MTERLHILLITLATSIVVGAGAFVSPSVATVAIQTSPERICR